MGTETWRVVIAGGIVEAFEIVPVYHGSDDGLALYGDVLSGLVCAQPVDEIGRRRCQPWAAASTANDALKYALDTLGWDVREIVPPGELTKAEAVAAERMRCVVELRRMHGECGIKRDAARTHGREWRRWNERAETADMLADKIERGEHVRGGK